MGLSLTTTIFLFVVCFSIGLLIGALFNRSRKQADAPPALEEASAEAAGPVQEHQPPARDESEVLRAGRDANGRVWIEMDGGRYDGRETMTPDQRRRLLNMVIDLRPWLDAPAAPAANPVPRPQPVQPVARPVTRPSIFAPLAPKTSAPAEEAKPKISLKSIVEQIDDVLQQKLPGSPYQNQEIHLLDGPGGTVIVEIEKKQYEGIDAVPEAGVKALIRQAIKDWEQSTQ